MIPIKNLNKQQKAQLLKCVQSGEIHPSELTEQSYLMISRDDWWIALASGIKLIIINPVLRAWVKMANNHVGIEQTVI